MTVKLYLRGKPHVVVRNQLSDSIDSLNEFPYLDIQD